MHGHPKVDKSQVQQQNVNWMSTVKTQISKPAIQKKNKNKTK